MIYLGDAGTAKKRSHEKRRGIREQKLQHDDRMGRDHMEISHGVRPFDLIYAHLQN